MSGGELQRVAIALCLGKPADVYLIDEPSAYLDSEQRLHAAKVIKRFILHAKKTGNLTLKFCFVKFCLSYKFHYECENYFKFCCQKRRFFYINNCSFQRDMFLTAILSGLKN